MPWYEARPLYETQWGLQPEAAERTHVLTSCGLPGVFILWIPAASVHPRLVSPFSSYVCYLVCYLVHLLSCSISWPLLPHFPAAEGNTQLPRGQCAPTLDIPTQRITFRGALGIAS